MRDHDAASRDQQSHHLACRRRPIEPVPALTGAGHVERAARQARLLGASLDVATLHAGLAVQPARLLEQGSGDVDARDRAASLREQPRQASRAGAEVHHACARAREAPGGQPLDQLDGKTGPMTGVVGRGAAEVGWTGAHWPLA